MQTLSRYSPPRNRPTYSHDGIFAHHLTGRSPRFQAINAAEYYIWRACKLSLGYRNLLERAEYEACKAKARLYISLAQEVGR